MAGFWLTLITLLLNYSVITRAATTTLNAVINPGSLTIANPSIATISAVTLEGISQTSTGSLGAFTVTDNRGSGAGWSVTFNVSPFTCCNGAQAIDVSNLTMNPGNLTVVSGKSVGVLAGDAHRFMSADDSATLMTAVGGSGLGSYRVSPTLTLTIPTDAYAGTYTATLTVTVI